MNYSLLNFTMHVQVMIGLQNNLSFYKLRIMHAYLQPSQKRFNMVYFAGGSDYYLLQIEVLVSDMISLQ